jgi:RNA polymerase sigma factor (sigma-70 family)
VYSDFYPIVFSAVVTRVQNDDDAKDICQEVFYRLYQKFDEVGNVRKWLFTALKLVVMEFFRKKENREIDIDEVFNNVAMTFVNGFRDARIIISEAMDNDDNFKDSTERVIFELIAYNNYTYRDVSKQLGITRRQVEYRYTQIVDRILRYLKEKGIEDIEDLL